MKEQHQRRIPGALAIALVLASILFSQSACMFKKKVKPEAVVSAPVRLVLLPFNVPSGDKDLRWTAMAAPILLAKAGEAAKGLDILPLWQTMPTVLNAAGTSRGLTEESASTIAAWTSAKWSVMGELAPAKNGVTLVIDFVPARSNSVPFRYLKTGKMDSLAGSFDEAYIQFLRYLVSRPFAQAQDKAVTMTSVKDLAEALDREYGWSVEAEPGKAQDAVSSLMRSDERLARMLFSPILYPSLAEKKVDSRAE